MVREEASVAEIQETLLRHFGPAQYELVERGGPEGRECLWLTLLATEWSIIGTLARSVMVYQITKPTWAKYMIRLSCLLLCLFIRLRWKARHSTSIRRAPGCIEALIAQYFLCALLVLGLSLCDDEYIYMYICCLPLTWPRKKNLFLKVNATRLSLFPDKYFYFLREYL